MALAGDIVVTLNGGGVKNLGYWTCTRTDRIQGEENTYTVEVAFTDSQGVYREVAGEITHAFSQGALILASKALAWADKEMQPYRETAEEGMKRLGYHQK